MKRGYVNTGLLGRHCGRGPAIQAVDKENTFINRLDPGSMSGMTTQTGFTLIELLVVVLIIGVLTAVALPQYQTAVDKSRYATLMPMAKSVANAQEAFYMNGGHYSDDLAYLDVQLPNDPSGTVADVGDGLKVEISEDSEYGYVKMSKEGLENNYIIYQDNSLNYPKEIHCEALTGSERAERLCKTLGGSFISGSLTDGYDTYVLEGGGSGTPWSLAHAGPAGWQRCDTYPCTKPCTREVKAGYTCTGTYNEDHTYNELVCQDNICTSMNYSDEDKKLTRDTCIMQGNVCKVKASQTYDENGKISKADYTCLANNADGSCKRYMYNIDYTYDSNGNRTRSQSCSDNITYINNSHCVIVDYTYNGNNKMTSQRTCTEGSIPANGTCSSYSHGTDYTYDSNGRQTHSQTCHQYNADGGCNSGSNTDYTYDSNGNMTRQQSCNMDYVVAGRCRTIQDTMIFTYDSDGKQTSMRQCMGANCGIYADGYDYMYDEQGNKTAERKCSSWSGKTCSRWSAWQNFS